jgi:hypothetical protein
MNTRLDYPEIIKTVLQDYAEFWERGGYSSLRALFNDEQQSYMLLDIGWYGDEYIHNATIHIEIIDGKIWIQNDDTEEGIATALLEAGVPHTDIVLGFYHPRVRPHTEFAAG